MAAIAAISAAVSTVHHRQRIGDAAISDDDEIGDGRQPPRLPSSPSLVRRRSSTAVCGSGDIEAAPRQSGYQNVLPSSASPLFLSPSSAYYRKNNGVNTARTGGSNAHVNPNARRRNSYAAAPSTPIPQCATNNVDEADDDETSKITNFYGSDAVVNRRSCRSNRVNPPVTSMMMAASSSSHFLDPTAAFRRRLPPTPPGTDAAGVSTLPPPSPGIYSGGMMPIRRGSSPRVLPTPPPLSPPGARYGSCASGGFSRTHSNSSSIESKSPPPYHLDACGGVGDLVAGSSSGVLERRPSTGRRLPPEPKAAPPLAIMSVSQYAAHSQPPVAESADFLSASSSASENPILLQRSVSTRSTGNQIRSNNAQLPPMPMSSPNYNASSAASGSPRVNGGANGNMRLMRTTSSSDAVLPVAAALVIVQEPPPSPYEAAGYGVVRSSPTQALRQKLASTPPATQTSAPASRQLKRLPTPEMGVSMLGGGGATDTANSGGKTVASASQSPRVSVGAISCASEEEAAVEASSPRERNSTTATTAFARLTAMNKSNASTTAVTTTTTTATATAIAATPVASSGGATGAAPTLPFGYTPVRKYSDTFDASLARNGSMAFLLEQQHILRRELCVAPSMQQTAQAAPNGGGGGACSRSNSSSLSPSIEQLNCTVSNTSSNSSSSAATTTVTTATAHAGGSSRSGSDAEESLAAATAAAACDARMHGIDPSLYGAGATQHHAMTYSSGSLNSAASSYSGPDVTTAAAAPSSPSATSTADFSATMGTNGTNGTGNTSALATADGVGVPPRPRGLGLIHCTLQHFPVRKRLRVSVLKIEGLAGELRPDLEIQPFCKVSLMPGKKQSSVVKRGRDAVFNQEFFFDGITTDELSTKTLSIEVCHQSAQKLQKDLEIGEIAVPLKDLTQLPSKKEVRIVEELKYSVSNKKLGKIYLTSCIEKEARRLTINLIKVDDLPKWGIIGAPDVCVRITMSQGNAQPQTKSSRVLKSTTCAVYKEAVMFLISTNKADLQHTRLTISVHDLSRSVTGDDVIGSVYLGELALDKSECEQWRQTVEHWGKEYKGCHHLKSNRQRAPDVHVSETQSDTEDVE